MITPPIKFNPLGKGDHVDRSDVPVWGTDAERDARHEEVMRRFPGGLSWDQFVYVVLESARDETGLVEAPSLVGNFFDRHSRMMRLFMDGLIDSSGGHNDPLRWRITPKGREVLAKFKQTHPEYAANPGAQS